MPAVAICIVTFNSEADLPDCLAAVAAQEYDPLEVVVVDCASSDRSVEIARRHPLPGRVEVIELSENLGFAGGMNIAIDSSEAPFILSLNPDARQS